VVVQQAQSVAARRLHNHRPSRPKPRCVNHADFENVVRGVEAT
jgi:hypothetical protein